MGQVVGKLFCGMALCQKMATMAYEHKRRWSTVLSDKKIGGKISLKFTKIFKEILLYWAIVLIIVALDVGFRLALSN